MKQVKAEQIESLRGYLETGPKTIFEIRDYLGSRSTAEVKGLITAATYLIKVYEETRKERNKKPYTIYGLLQ